MRHALTVPSLALAAMLAIFLALAPPGAGPLAGRAGVANAVSPAPAPASAGIEDFMLVVHGPKGLLTQIKEALDGSGPADDKAWKAVKARAAIISFLTETILRPFTPEKGDKASWKARVDDYQRMTRALVKALDQKDSSAAKAERGKLAKSCDACHKAHK